MLDREEQIQKKLNDAPKKYKGVYKRATQKKGGGSTAIKAFCLECVGWQREEIKICTSLGCPLFLYRPYRR